MKKENERALDYILIILAFVVIFSLIFFESYIGGVIAIFGMCIFSLVFLILFPNGEKGDFKVVKNIKGELKMNRERKVIIITTVIVVTTLVFCSVFMSIYNNRANIQENVETEYEKISDDYWIERVTPDLTCYHIRYGEELNGVIPELAINIGNIEGVKRVYYEHYVMQVTKSPLYRWSEIDGEVKTIVDNFLSGNIEKERIEGDI